MNEADPRRDDLTAYALGALEPGPAADLEEHIAGCGACREYLRWLRPAVELLPASVEQLRAPPAVRKAVLAEVRADAARTAGARPRLRQLSFGGFALRPAMALGATLALVVAGVGGYLLHGSGSGIPHSVVGARPTAVASPGTVRASLERVGDSGILVVDRMPPLPRRSVYEVWVQRGDMVRRASTFVPNKDGTANAAVPGPLDGASAVLVTKEPRGGSIAPSTVPLLRAPLN